MIQEGIRPRVELVHDTSEEHHPLAFNLQERNFLLNRNHRSWTLDNQSWTLWRVYYGLQRIEEEEGNVLVSFDLVLHGLGIPL